MKGGLYSSSPAKFFRDLLLLVNNAIVFYPGDSMEANAAMEIRVMVRKEISQRHSKSDASLVKAASLESHLAPKMEEGELFNLLKPGICRKRSSIKAKASPAVDERREEKPRMPFAMLEEPKITKKRSRERIPTVSSNLKPEDPEVIDNKASLEPRKQRSKGVVSSSADHGGGTKVVEVNKAKKRGTAIFLNRMSNSSTPSSNGLLVDAMRNTPLSSGSTLSKRGEKKQQHSTRRSSETREMKAKVAAPSPVKRSVGRPPKRTPPPHPPLVSKEGWETGEPDSTSLSTVQKKKRSRKM